MAAKQSNPEAPPAAPAPAPRGGFLGKLLIAGFVVLVVTVECAVAYFWIPSAEQVAALAEKNLQKKLPAALAHEGGEAQDGEAKPMMEVDLGEYSVTITRPNSPTVMRVDFHLVGTAEESVANELKAAFDRNVHRFRDMVISEIRNLEVSDFADPGLGLIKRRILEKSTTLFGKPILKSIVFPDFSYFEQ
jgi:flagellar FliL protein